MFYINEVKKIEINFEQTNPCYFEASVDSILHVSKTLNEIKNDNDYFNYLIEKGYEKVVPNYLKYDMNDTSFTVSKVIYDLKKYKK